LATGAPIVTVSIGVAGLDESLHIDQLSELIAEADRRLYVAKRQRNCVVSDDLAAAPVSGGVESAAGSLSAVPERHVKTRPT
jgi:hypothetical protein